MMEMKTKITHNRKTKHRQAKAEQGQEGRGALSKHPHTYIHTPIHPCVHTNTHTHTIEHMLHSAFTEATELRSTVHKGRRGV